MKYRDISWELIINGERASCDDNALDFIAEEIQHGYTNGLFTQDDTDYYKIDTLKEKLTTLLGRDIDCSYEDSGELEELLEIAKKNNDEEIADTIKELLEEYTI